MSAACKRASSHRSGNLGIGRISLGSNNMPSRVVFKDQLSDAYQHLYDFVRLRTHQLTKFLITDPSLNRKEKALRLHRTLLDVIDELDPGPTAPVMSREWRRYRLMVLRYVDGLDPQTVADELAISRRHYYREHDAALNRIAEILWDRRNVSTPLSLDSTSTADDKEENETAGRLELLHLEATRLAQAKRCYNIQDMVERMLPLLEDLLNERSIRISLDFSQASTKPISIDQSLLRQLLLAILGHVAELATHAVVHVSTDLENATLHVTIRICPADTMALVAETDTEERLSAFEEIANLIGIRVLPIKVKGAIVGFELLLPIQPECTVLIVDDNEDVLELYQRYLSSSGYSVIVTKSATEALRLANELLPQVAILDLMMPDHDGWDLMQSLLNQTNTQHTPIIVCSVLRQKELALSLGAAAFIQKPVGEQLLLNTVEKLVGQTHTSQV